MIYKKYTAFLALVFFNAIIFSNRSGANSGEKRAAKSKHIDMSWLTKDYVSKEEVDVCKATFTASAMRDPDHYQAEVYKLYRRMPLCFQKDIMEKTLKEAVNRRQPKVAWQLAKTYGELVSIENKSFPDAAIYSISAALNEGKPSLASGFIGACLGALTLGDYSTQEGLPAKQIPLSFVFAGAAGFATGAYVGFHTKQDHSVKSRFYKCIEDRNTQCVMQLSSEISQYDQKSLIPDLGNRRKLLQTAMMMGAGAGMTYRYGSHSLSGTTGGSESSTRMAQAGMFGLSMYVGNLAGQQVRRYYRTDIGDLKA